MVFGLDNLMRYDKISSKMRELDQANQEQFKYERAHQLQNVGFDKLGKSPLFRKNNFVVAVDGDKDYQFFVDYYSHLDLSTVRSIRITNGEKTALKDKPHLFIVHRNPNGSVGMHETVLGGSGMSGPAENPNVIDEFDKPLNQQLVETGFTAVDEEAGVYKTVFDDVYYGKTDVYVLLEDGRVSKIVHPILKSYPKRERGRKLVRDLGVTLTGFETRREKVPRYDSDAQEIKEQESVYDVLTARNSTMELEFFADGEFRITKLLKDIEPEDLGVSEVTPRVESAGFVVGGVNSTELIRNLPSLNDIAIEDLEGRIRIGDISGDRDDYLDEMLAGLPVQNEKARKQLEDSMKRMSTSGSFLGENESLRDLLAEDNDYVLSLGLTHQDLGRMIKYTTALTEVLGIEQFTYKGRRYSTSWIHSTGFQGSPFADGTQCSSDFFIINEDTGAEFYSSVLHGEMIERYGFYEGKGVGYRLEPKDVVEVFDFLKEEGQQKLTRQSRG